MAALEAFRKGEAKLLIASDVAARGLDIPEVSHVFNFDVPHHADDYVHRVGRTGRAGKTGTAITIVAPIDQKSVAAIEKLTGQTIPWAEQPAAPAVTSTAAAEPRRDEPRRDESQHRGHRGGRNNPSQRPAKRPPAPVASLEERRPRRPPEPARQQPEDDELSHLPAFLLRPVRAKA